LPVIHLATLQTKTSARVTAGAWTDNLLPLLTIVSSSRSPGGLLIWCLFGICGGLYLFWRGFRILQRKRLILDTPTAKVRSAAIGLVEVNGLAIGPYTITAPITTMPCYFYRTMAWQWRQEGKNKQWVKVADESLHVPFFLDDNTGRLLVDPSGAEMDIHRDFHEEFSNSFFSSAPDIPSNVASFLTRNGVSTDKKIKIEEYCIKPKNALFVLGTLAENPGINVSPAPIRDEAPHALKFALSINGSAVNTGFGDLDNSPVVPKRTFSWQAKPLNGSNPPEVVRLSNTVAPAKAADMTQQQKIAAALTKAGITSPAAWAAAGVVDSSALSGEPGSSANAAAAAAPAQFDLHPSVVLMKGSNNPAFFISWHSQKDVVQSLGWKSATMIWGGPLLTLLSVYILLLSFGWL
jgi:hypothetical protein